MRATSLLLLLLAGSLSAGESDWLTETTRKFSSDSADVRDAASAAIRRHLADRLAPLLEAMKSSDPEVARRAQETLRSLLPDRPPAPEAPNAAAGQQQGVFVINQRAGRNIRIVLKNKAGRVQFFDGNPANPKLKKLGIEGHELDDPVLRKQLRIAAGRGYVIEKVAPRSLAAKFGFQAADILISVNGRRVKDGDAVQRALGTLAQRGLRVKILRDGVPVELPVR